MKRIFSFILALMLLFTALPLTASAAGTEEDSLRQELATHGSVDMAMNVYASKLFRYYQHDFVSMLQPGAHAFQSTVDYAYNYSPDRGESVHQALLNLGYAYAEGDGSWDLQAEQVALYIKYLLYLADLEEVPFSEALGYIQNAMPQRNKQMDHLNFLADLLTVGFDALGKGFLRLGDGILKGADAIPEGKLFYQMLEGAFKAMGIFNNTSDVLTGVTDLVSSSAPVKGLLNSYQRASAGLAILEAMTGAAIGDPLLQTARDALYGAYTDFQAEMGKLAADPASRAKLQDPEALNAMFNGILASKLEPWYPQDKLMDSLETTRKLADVFLTGGLSTTMLNGSLHVAEQVIGTKSAYAHMHAMFTIDEIYTAVASSMHHGDTWTSRCLYAEEIQRLCLLAMLGETHMYHLVSEDAGAGRNLWNSINKLITGNDQAQANLLWYDLTTDHLSSVYCQAQEFIDALMNHYAALCAVATDITPLLGHENESTGTVSGYLIKDKWFALPDGSGKPDYTNPNPEAGEPVKDTAVQLLVGETVIASTVTRDDGYYRMTYPRHLAQGQLTIRVSPEGVNYAKRDMSGPTYTANAMPSYYRFDADLESPAQADGAAVIAPSLPYADDYFLQAGDYSHDLALASLGLSAAATNEELIRAAWGSMGYSVYASGRYDLPLNTAINAAPYTIATKTFTDPDAREGEPTSYTVVALCVGSELDAAGMANAVASGNSSAAAQRIADDLEQCLLSVWQEGVPLRLWCMGFSWGGKVADSVLSALVGRPALTGKFTTAGVYTFAAPGAQVAQGYNYVYAQDPIGMGLTEPAEKTFTIYGVAEGAAQKRVASIFHQLTQCNTAYDPARYENPSTLGETLRRLPAGEQRTAMITGLTQWRMLRSAANGDFRLMDSAARHAAALTLTNVSPTASQTAATALASSPLPVLKVLPEAAEAEVATALTDVAALCELYAAPMDSALATSLLEVFFALGDDLGNPTSAQSAAFAHHPEMYLAWLLGLDGPSLTSLQEPDAFGGRVLEQPVNLKGVVINWETGAPMPNVAVTITGSSFSHALTTDENGQWKLLVPVEDLSLSFTQSGFEPATETVSATQFSQGVVELTTYMHKIPMPLLIITTENHMEKGDDYRTEYAIPKVWSSINNRFGQQFEEVIAPLYANMEREITDNRSYTCSYHDGTHNAFLEPASVFSTGYLLSIVINDGYYHCDIGHNVNTGYTYTFDVATGRQLTLLDLLDPANGNAGHDFINVIQACAQEDGVSITHGEAERVYAHMLKEGTKGKYASWSLAADGIHVYVDNLNIGILPLNNVHIPYERLSGILAPEYLPAAPVGQAICQFTTEDNMELGHLNTPGSSTVVEVKGLLNQIWIRDDYGSHDETPSERFRFFYAFGLNDALVRLPVPLDTTFTVQWEDSTGVHFVHGGP